MNLQHVPLAMAAAALACLALVACDRETTTQAQDAGARVGRQIERALDTTQQQLAVAGEKAQQKLAEAGEKTQQKIAEVREDAASRPDSPAASRLSASAGEDRGSVNLQMPKIDRAALSDAAITASILAHFVKDPDLSALRIDVDTQDGVVVLNGIADSEAARKRAAQLAGAVKGVREVRNHLTVKKT